MDNRSIYKYQTYSALLLAFLLIGCILIKPAHILLIHHERAECTNFDPVHKILSIHHDHDCAICNFEFCSFIPQKQVIVPQVNITYTIELASRMVACFVGTSIHNFQLRAPPVI